VRNLLLWTQAQKRSERSEWRRTLALVNTVSKITGNDTVTLSDLYGHATPYGGGARDDEAYQAFKGRTQAWAQDLVTDFPTPES
jgi:hypothetical protein